MHYYYRYQRKYYLLGDQKKSVSSISCKNVNIIIPADMSPETQTVDGNDAISPKPLTFHSEFDKFLLLNILIQRSSHKEFPYLFGLHADLPAYNMNGKVKILMMNERIHDEFLKILAEELIPAMGCTEPIALAYAGARAREVLGCLPDRVIAYCSGNMIKNVRCVTIPNSESMVGIEAGVMLGIVGGNASKCMEVLEDLTDEDRKTAAAMLRDGVCTVEYLDSEIPLHIILELHKDASVVTLEIRYDHTNITKITKDEEVIFSSDHKEGGCSLADRSLLSVDNIKDFADQVPLKDIHELLDRVIIHNMNIAYEGMAGSYGLGIGKIIKESYPDGVAVRMKAYAAAGSEARMGGCDMPVMINSGSGNQGIASSVPVIVYARENNICQERLYRALAFSSLLTSTRRNLSASCLPSAAPYPLPAHREPPSPIWWAEPWNRLRTPSGMS